MTATSTEVTSSDRPLLGRGQAEFVQADLGDPERLAAKMDRDPAIAAPAWAAATALIAAAITPSSDEDHGERVHYQLTGSRARTIVLPGFSSGNTSISKPACCQRSIRSRP